MLYTIKFLSRVFTDLLLNSHKLCRGFHQAMKARRTCFISFIKLLFSVLTKRIKDDIRNTYVYYNFFHETVNSYNLETVNLFLRYIRNFRKNILTAKTHVLSKLFYKWASVIHNKLVAKQLYVIFYRNYTYRKRKITESFKTKPFLLRRFLVIIAC